MVQACTLSLPRKIILQMILLSSIDIATDATDTEISYIMHSKRNMITEGDQINLQFGTNSANFA